MHHKPQIVAHRGAHFGEIKKENTKEAFLAAIDIGCDYIECDVLQTSDGVLLCFHDQHFQDKNISDYTFAELQSVLKRQQIQICTFKEYLSLYREIKLDIEIKCDGYEHNIWALLQDIPPERYVIKSFKLNVLQTFRNYSEVIQLGWLISKKYWDQKIQENNSLRRQIQTLLLPKTLSANKRQIPIAIKKHVLSICNTYQILFVSPDISIVDKEFVMIFHETDIEIWPWTIKTEQQFLRMKNMNIQTVVTDIPKCIIDLSC